MENRPNIIFVITDQQRYDSVGFNGNPVVMTPHLDALAAEGAVFDRAYSPCPLCSPARVSIMRGVYPHRHGYVDNWGEPPSCVGPSPGWVDPPSEQMPWMGELFRDAGYETAYVGKWHCLTGEDRRGFEDFVVRLGDFESDDTTNDFLRYVRSRGYDELTGKKDGKEYVQKGPFYGVSKFSKDDYPATYIFREACRFVRRRHDKPFILGISTRVPHIPFDPPAPYHSMYDPDRIPLPESTKHPKPFKHNQRERGFPKEYDTYRSADPHLLQTWWAHYLGMVTLIDDLIGELFTSLEDSGLLDNTVFIFTSDHGETLGSHRLPPKGAFMYDSVTRVPLLFWSKNSILPSRIEHPTSLTSILPTCLDLAGICTTHQFDGPSLRSAMRGGLSVAAAPVYAEYNLFFGHPYPVRMIVDGEWKLVSYYGMAPEVYNLKNDPEELNDLWGVPRYMDVAATLADTLVEWMNSRNDRYTHVPGEEGPAE